MKHKWGIFSFLAVFTTCLVCFFFINYKSSTHALEKPSYKSTSYKNATDKSSINDKKTIYITFDDGPTVKTTNKLLDILSKYNIKATFFVVGKEINGREDILRRIYEEGHGIGLHTYSHDFKKIYTSNDTFISEMLQTSDQIKDLIGIEPKFIRFPGGSHNRLNKSFLNKLHNYGFMIFDWTNNSEDGVNPNLKPEKLYTNSLKRIISKKTFPGIILLMHCNENNINTCKALPEIIEYYKARNYEFKILSNSTPEYISE